MPEEQSVFQDHAHRDLSREQYYGHRRVISMCSDYDLSDLASDKYCMDDAIEFEEGEVPVPPPKTTGSQTHSDSIVRKGFFASKLSFLRAMLRHLLGSK